MIHSKKIFFYIAPLWFIAVFALPAMAETGDSAPNLIMTSLRSLGSLLLILALIVLAAWAAKKYLPFLQQPYGKGEGIQVIAMKALGPKRSIHLIEVEGKKVLIGSTESSITLLKEFPDLELEK